MAVLLRPELHPVGSQSRWQDPHFWYDPPMPDLLEHPARQRLARASVLGLRWLQALLAVPGLLTVSARHWWVADICANLRVQWCLGAAGLLAVSLVLRRFREAAFSLGLVIAFLIPLLPGIQSVADPDRTQALESQQQHHGSQPAEAAERQHGNSPLRICVCNVFTANRQHALIRRTVTEHEPDLIGLLEVSSEHITECAHALQTSYPYQAAEPQEPGNFGIALLSRVPLSDVRVLTLNERWIPTIEAVAQTDAGRVRVFVTHTLPPMSQRAFLHRNQHLRLLAEHLRAAGADEDLPVIVIGDLNLTPWSPCFDDWLTDAGLTNCSAGHGYAPTWFRFNSPLCGLMLDHACCSPSLVCTQRLVSGEFGSDHRAVVFDLQRRPD